MELRHLRYFVAVVEEESFTKAASRLHVAQPGVSAQIRQLEHELGEELLDRSGRSLRLTQAGAAVLPHARDALAAADGARQAVDEMSGLLRGRVALGMVTACGAIDVPNLLAGFHRAHPAVEIVLREANSDELLDGVRVGDLDLAWVGVAGPAPFGIDSQVVVDESLVAAIGYDDPSATRSSRSSIRMAELRGRPLITLPPGTGLRACLDRACATAGFLPTIAFEANSPVMLGQLAGQGLGTAILPSSVAVAMRDQVHALTVRSPQLRSRIEIAWRSEGHISTAAAALIRHARTYLDERKLASA
jgi:DNA-binding transcriptional LysR family regulator